jgi:3-hydroxybutyryl-CoA dehydratase
VTTKAGRPSPRAHGSWKLHRVDAARMKILALLLDDPNPVHFDPSAARRLNIADREVNQGPSNMAMVINMVSQTWPEAEIRRLRIRLLGQVHADERVEVLGDVVESSVFGEAGSEYQRMTVSFVLAVNGRGVVANGTAELVSRLESTDGVVG